MLREASDMAQHEHPLDALLFQRRLSRNVRKRLRRRWDKLPEPPSDLVAWFAAELARTREAARSQEEAQRRRKEDKRQREQAQELRRRLALPRLAGWRIERGAARREFSSRALERYVHPDDALTIIERTRAIAELRERRHRARLSSDPLSPIGANPGSPTRLMNRLVRTLSRKRVEELDARLKALAPQIGALRRRKRLDPYGLTLLALYDAQRMSDLAKSRPADGLRLYDYMEKARKNTDHAASNYRRSRAARSSDYVRKQQRLREACTHAQEAGVPFGWSRDDCLDAPWVAYFDLSTGQVSFHSPVREAGPDYLGQWDGKRSTLARLVDALLEYCNRKPARLRRSRAGPRSADPLALERLDLPPG